MASGLHNVSYGTWPELTRCQLRAKCLIGGGFRQGRPARSVGAFLEVSGGNHSTLTPLPRGASLGFQVSNRVACEHWLYVMESTAGLVKVGSTHQPANRYRALRRSPFSRYGLACRALYPLGSITRDAALDRELAIHADLRVRWSDRLNGRSEWYRASAAAACAVIESHLSNHDTDALVGLS